MHAHARPIPALDPGFTAYARTYAALPRSGNHVHGLHVLPHVRKSASCIRRACMHMHGQYLLWTPDVPRMHAHTRRIHDLATTCTACTCCPTYTNLLEHPCSIRASPPPILKSTNQIIIPPDPEIPLVHLQSANQILFPLDREIPLVRMQRPASTPTKLCTTDRPHCWHIATGTVDPRLRS